MGLMTGPMSLSSCCSVSAEVSGSPHVPRISRVVLGSLPQAHQPVIRGLGILGPWDWKEL